MTTVTEHFDVVKMSVGAHFPADLWNVAIEAKELEDLVGAWIQTSCTWEVASKAGTRFLDVPRDWWQHAKERFAPQWYLKRWPVLVTTYSARHFYPEIEVPHRSLRSHYSSFEVVHRNPTPT